MLARLEQFADVLQDSRQQLAKVQPCTLMPQLQPAMKPTIIPESTMVWDPKFTAARVTHCNPGIWILQGQHRQAILGDLVSPCPGKL